MTRGVYPNRFHWIPGPTCEVTVRKCVMQLLWFLVVTAICALSQETKPQVPAEAGAEFSGMYNFLRDGEFVQVTVEDAGHVTGFVSRYSERENDRGAFLDHFFKEGRIDGNKLTFTTATVHAVWFEFRGTVERGEGKKSGEEGCYVLKGTLIEYVTDESKKTTSRSREVALKSFPQDVTPQPVRKN